jgi:hypothetical protein
VGAATVDTLPRKWRENTKSVKNEKLLSRTNRAFPEKDKESAGQSIDTN